MEAMIARPELDAYDRAGANSVTGHVMWIGFLIMEFIKDAFFLLRKIPENNYKRGRG